MRLLALLLPILPLADAGSGAPDASLQAWTDSLDPEGPPHTWRDTTDARDLGLAEDASFALTLPFDVRVRGRDWSTATVSTEGTVVFSGTYTGACPDSVTSADGVAVLAGPMSGARVSTELVGRWPDRTFIVSWEDVTGTAGGPVGRVQAWFLEGRDEVVIVHDDVAFASGGGFVSGVFGNGGGRSWQCAVAPLSGSSAWFGDATERPARTEVRTDELGTPWYGPSALAGAGRVVAAGDVNGDGTADVAVASPDDGAGTIALVFRPSDGGELADAPVIVRDSRPDGDLGAAMVLADLDGDGLDDLAAGAPADTTVGVQTGAVYVWNDLLDAPLHTPSSAVGTWQGDSVAQAQLGSALDAGDVDGDGYADLLLGGPTHDGSTSGTDAGGVWLVYGGLSGGWSGTHDSRTEGVRFEGAGARDQLGRGVLVADLDQDGDGEMILGAPFADGGPVADLGTVYVLEGGSWSGTHDVASAAVHTMDGPMTGSRFGAALAAGDLLATGTLDLVVGAPRADLAGTDDGAVYLFVQPMSAPVRALPPDAILSGAPSTARLGSWIAAADIDGDAQTDLLVGAPNVAAGAAGGGAVYVFRDLRSGLPSGIADASQRVLGTGTGAAIGGSFAIGADPAAAPVFLAAPGDTWVHAGEGAVHAWTWRSDFLDDDGDGWVGADVGGNDCDDESATTSPDGTDTDGDGVDQDCDGWRDGRVATRSDAEGWAHDVADIGGDTIDATFLGFEGFASGAGIPSSGDVSFTPHLQAMSSVYGALPADNIGARVPIPPGSDPSTVRIDFAAGVDALSLRLLDAEGTFQFAALDASGATIAQWSDTFFAQNFPGGAEVDVALRSTARALTITAPAGEAFGLDDIGFLLGTATDSDGDGYAEDAGDCDDTVATTSPGADELLGNGVDDDCDGVVDAGEATRWSTLTTWTAATTVPLGDVVDFEILAEGDAFARQYAMRGVLGGGSLAHASFGTTAANGAMGVDATSLTLDFAEAQPSVAFTLLDVDADVTLVASVGGVTAYTLTLPAGAGFVGLTFPVAVDRIIVSSTDTVGLDDLRFAGLGLDDHDGDGLTEAEGDCDDTDPTAYAGAPETWYDGTDSDCAGDNDNDADGDGFELALDCADGDSAISPSATEVYYDGIDTDCDAASDFDADRDGHDDAAFAGDDCDDDAASTYAGAGDTWYDGVDSDCAGNDDYDADGDGFPFDLSGLGGDCDDTAPSTYPGAADAPYDGLDSDCGDDLADDYDADGDGFVSSSWGGDDCEDSDLTAYPGAAGERCYDGVDTDCDGSNEYDCDEDGSDSDLYGGTDCDDADAGILPGASDTMGDGVDSNCDGALEYDGDGDGYDDAADGGADCDDADPAVNPGADDACYDGVDANCDAADDFDCDADGAGVADDCDDLDAGRYPGALDFPYDGVDGDCDGADDFDVDGDGAAASWYGGTDCDDDDATVVPGASDAPYDGVDSDCAGDDDFDADGDGAAIEGAGGADCDDTDASIFPGATETAGDGVDSDCDGTDPDPTSCTDCDGDGVSAPTDCDDTDAGTYPGAPDAPYDGADSDCAGDDDYDQDADGFRARAHGGTDCDDTSADRNPGIVTDACGGGDEDCDGTVDEDCDLDTGTDDTGGDTSDSDTGDDSADTGTDTGDSGAQETATDSGDSAPADEALTDPDEVARGKRGCASVPDGRPVGALVLLAAALATRRRRA